MHAKGSQGPIFYAIDIEPDIEQFAKKSRQVMIIVPRWSSKQISYKCNSLGLLSQESIIVNSKRDASDI